MRSNSAGLALFLVALLYAPGVSASWEPVAPGIHYQHFSSATVSIHVARIDLTNDELRVVATRESDRNTRVSQFAQRNHALVAMNAGFFDEHRNPTGISVGPCGQWANTKDTAWGAVAAFGAGRVELYQEEETMEVAEPWIETAVTGWPTLIENCRARKSKELPGSNSFTRAPHPRSAIGFSRDGSLLYFIVADGRQEGIPGLTLPELAIWMKEQLGVCAAMNLDGGGSSALWIKDRIVNRPSGGKERRVADHLAVVRASDAIECESTTRRSSRPVASRP